MIDWSKADWNKSDTELAKILKTSRQNVSAARKRKGARASPEARGGDRKSLVSTSDSLTLRGTGKHRVRWAKAARAVGMSLNDWSIASLDAAAKKQGLL